MTQLVIAILGGFVAGNLWAYLFAVRGVNKRVASIVERSKPVSEQAPMRKLMRSQAITLPAITVMEAEMTSDINARWPHA